VYKINSHTKYAVNRHTVHFTLHGQFQGLFKLIKIHAHALSTTQCAANIPISIYTTNTVKKEHYVFFLVNIMSTRSLNVSHYGLS